MKSLITVIFLFISLYSYSQEYSHYEDELDTLSTSDVSYDGYSNYPEDSNIVIVKEKVDTPIEKCQCPRYNIYQNGAVKRRTTPNFFSISKPH